MMWKRNWLSIATTIFLLGSCFIVGKNAEDSLIKNLIIISAIAVDIKDEELLVTIQAIDSTAIKNSSTSQLGFILYQESGRTITEAIQKIHTSFSRFIFLDDVKVILVSEALAKSRGINDVVNYLFMEQSISSNTMFFVSKDTSAHNILAMFTPFQKVSSQRIVDMIENIKNYSSFAIPVYPNRVKNLLLNYPVVNNVIPYLRIVGDDEIGMTKENIETYQPASRITIDGMSYFKNDKLVDYLSNEESQSLLFLMNNIKGGSIEACCPEGDGFFSYFIKKSKTSFNVRWNKNSPKITVDVKVDERIIESECKDSFTHPNLEKFRKQLSDQVKDNITILIQKSQSEELDYIGIGKELYLSEPKKWRKIEKEWFSIYPETPFEVVVDISVTKTGDASSLE